MIRAAHYALTCAMLALPAIAGVDTTNDGATLEQWQEAICGPQVAEVWPDPAGLYRTDSGALVPLSLPRLSSGGWIDVLPWPGYATKVSTPRPETPPAPPVPPIPLPGAFWLMLTLLVAGWFCGRMDKRARHKRMGK